ncbi:hypothetical protein AXF42_Ash014802 [Apostasia shenzhenica]|uniref:glycerophosphodiester phosphodiesterase n=1 Tax=Apostasia shenzhenica TaxID=1088818 RepID=A0A2H9ZWF6_9ASPA|nr:hypothetical protein AXF42_Ash014802 [Apostasia shenzhenica]
MALKAVHVSEIPNLDQVPEVPAAAVPSISVSSSLSPRGSDVSKGGFRSAKFLVIGHRGRGMNLLSSADPRMKAVKENSILSFNLAGKCAVDFVEFDVQVTKDGCPIIFHDDFILTEEDGKIIERRTTDLCLKEFLSYGPQRVPGKAGKPLLRRTKDGRIHDWSVESEDPLCTLQEAFQNVDSHLGFNVELKFDDNITYTEEELIHTIIVILEVIYKFARDRSIIFSSFQPDAARLLKKLQSSYPVFFLTNGGTQIYLDTRRNSMEEALKLSRAGGLDGIVSEVKAIFRHPSMIHQIKESNLALLTYGQLNNVPEAVYMQHLMGVNGVIVDLVQEITEAVSDFITLDLKEEGKGKEAQRPVFSQKELSFLLKLIPELVQL